MKHQNMDKSIDYFNFCRMENDLPILDILNERFIRSFRVTLSNHLRMIANIKCQQDKMVFGDWLKTQVCDNCMFVVKCSRLNASILIKLDRDLAYAVVDILTGGDGKVGQEFKRKEMTQIELAILKDLGLKMIQDLNEAWVPVHQLGAQHHRTECNAQFLGLVPPESKMIRVSHQIEFGDIKGHLEILYPYSTLFPVRDKLFAA